MNYSVVDFSEVEPSSWDTLVDRSPDAWLFHRAAWISLMDDVFGDQLNRSFMVQRDGVAVAAVPTFLVRDRVWRSIPRAVYRFPYGGPAVPTDVPGRPKLMTQVMDLLEGRAREDGADAIEVTLQPLAPAGLDGLHPVNPLLAFGYFERSRPHWVLRLPDRADVAWKGLDGRARNQVGQAERAGVTVRRAQTVDEIRDYYGLHLETYARTGAPPFPQAYFEQTLRRLPNHANFFFAHAPDGAKVAAMNVMRLGPAAVYNSGASSAAGRDLRANHLLQWHAIRWLIEHGGRAYGLGEAFPAATGKEAGLDLFKRSFGAGMEYGYRGVRVLRPLTYTLSRWRSILSGDV